MFKKNYEGKIVHIVGGVTEYVGELADHPMNIGEFKGWIRLKNPCMMGLEEKENGQIIARLVRLGGDSKSYRPRVDMYFPRDVFFEIRIVDKQGHLYKAYKRQLDRPVMDKIISPDMADIAKVSQFRGRTH